MAIDELEFQTVCKRFQAEKGIGFSIRLVRGIAHTAAAYYAAAKEAQETGTAAKSKETDLMSEAMDYALDHHNVTRRAERSLYRQVMGTFFSRHAVEAKQKMADERQKKKSGPKPRAWGATTGPQLRLFK